MKTNRFQVELDKINESCKQCDHQNCQQCSLNFRKLEFQWALKEEERKERAFKQQAAQKKREQPLKAHARFV